MPSNTLAPRRTASLPTWITLSSQGVTRPLSQVCLGFMPRRELSPSGAQRRKRLRGHPLQDALLVLPRQVDHELLDAGLSVAADQVVEGVQGGPAVLLRPGGPVVERADDGPRVTADPGAVLIQDRVACPDLLGAAEGIPAVRPAGTDTEHPRAVGADRQRRPRLLDGARP